VGRPTHKEIQNNLKIAFEYQESGGIVVSMIMPIDEIKLQEWLHWDPCTNIILGVC
jgi:hypothetical protein